MWNPRHKHGRGYTGGRVSRPTEHGKRLQEPLRVDTTYLSLPPPRVNGQGPHPDQSAGAQTVDRIALASPVTFGDTRTGTQAGAMTYTFLRLEFDLQRSPYVIFVPDAGRGAPTAYVASSTGLRPKPLSNDPATPEGLQEVLGIVENMNIPLIAGRAYDLERRIQDAGYATAPLARIRHDRP